MYKLQVNLTTGRVSSACFWCLKIKAYQIASLSSAPPMSWNSTCLNMWFNIPMNTFGFKSKWQFWPHTQACRRRINVICEFDWNVEYSGRVLKKCTQHPNYIRQKKIKFALFHCAKQNPELLAMECLACGGERRNSPSKTVRWSRRPQEVINRIRK